VGSAPTGITIGPIPYLPAATGQPMCMVI
jgi:hypothetical protein